MSKLILTTGAGRGLGFAVASRHLAEGDEVYAWEYALTPELTALAEKHKNKLHVHRCDIGSTAGVNEAAAESLAAGRKLDVIYNVAGLYQHDARVGLAETDIDSGLHMYDVNGLGGLRVCKALLPLIGKGTVVANITSEAGSITNCYRSYEYVYCISKAAANMAARLLSNELHPRGARVLCFHPGWLRTQMGGERAAASEFSITPEKSAEDITGIVARIDEIPPSWMFMQHDGQLLPW
jgi:NAD(P)-dependent dehydrogenase (short-subunit alcohol dehydrogenase family)